jgi:hypothetical protein
LRSNNQSHVRYRDITGVGRINKRFGVARGLSVKIRPNLPCG